MPIKEKVGLFFGSFNPVHIGHMIIANFMVEHTDLEKVWMVVSPHNPLKNKKSLANDYDRLYLVKIAIGDNPHLEASDIEFGLPKPSYTIDTLTYLHERYPHKDFSLIMGGDNLGTLHKWKNYEQLLLNHIYVYDRPGYDLGDLKDHENVHIVKAPLLQLSASYIRKQIQENKSIQYLVPGEVYDQISAKGMYR